MLSENRENVRSSLASVRDLTASLNDVVAKDRVKVEQLLDGMDMLRARGDRVLYQADLIAGQGVQILSRGAGPRSSDRSRTSATPPTGATSWSRRSTPTRSS